jgi:hypothetical protein
MRFTLMNTGGSGSISIAPSGPAISNAAFIIGDGFFNTDTCKGATLSPGQKCSFSVTLEPSATSGSGTLSYETSAGTLTWPLTIVQLQTPSAP